MFEVTESEVARLESLENVVEVGIRRGLDAFAALKEIRDEKLYHAKGYDDFDSYCRKEWEIGSNLAYKNILAVETRARLCTNVQKHDTNKITSEGQLRQLSSVPDESLDDVIEEAESIAHEEGLNRLSGRILKKARSRVLGEKFGKYKAEPKAIPDDVDWEPEKPAVNLPPEKLLQSQRIALESADKLRRHLGALGYTQYDKVLLEIIIGLKELQK